jgi:Ca-activated chloride channel family protein
MNQPSIESLLSRVRAPAPDSAARLRAQRAALAEFARVSAANEAEPDPDSSRQGFRDMFRPMFMNTVVSRRMYAGVATVCVVGLGVAMVWPIFSQYGERVYGGRTAVTVELKPPAKDNSLPKAAAQPQAERRPDPQAPASAVSPPSPVRAPLSARIESRRAPASALPPHIALNEIDGPEQIVIDDGHTGLQVPLDMKRETVVTNVAPSPALAQVSDKYVFSDRQKKVGFIAGATTGLAVPAEEPESRDKFQHFEINPLKRVADEPVSTFSVDVDTASYSFSRRMLNAGSLPQKDAVRVEEMINYFDYAWPAPKTSTVPFEPTVIVSDSPWGKGRKLVHIGIKGYEVDRAEAPDVNLVLLLDVSGSMDSPDKLPLAVKSMELLLGSLKPSDTVGIVVYAGAAGTVLEPTPVRQKEKILEALRSLQPGGSTAGAEGIERAYQLAEKNFRKNGVNRILLATDGDFNVGIDDTEQLKGFVERKREKGVFLSVLGFGEGNYRDELAQALAQNGNGVAAYIDSLNEARKVLVQEATSSLFTIAKDVKLQVEFNPATVAEYRLVGYETRSLRREDFNNDAIDAGDVGSGHTVTAIYEITPVGSSARMVDESRYSPSRQDDIDEHHRADSREHDEYGYLKIRYKLPTESRSRLLERPIPLKTAASPALLREVQFSTAVAGFGQLLRGGSYTGALTYEDVVGQAQAATGEDRFGYRAEFVRLVREADRLAK